MTLKIWNRAITVFGLLLLGAPSASAFPVRFGLAPDNNQGQLRWIVEHARKNLIINVYEFESPPLTRALATRISQGVSVVLMIEGQPIPKRRIGNGGIQAITEIQAAMKAAGNPNNRIFLMLAPKDGRPRRYNFNHAKYVVADGRYSLVSSENFGPRGFPDAGMTGNRGWTALLDHPGAANRLAQVFRADINPSAGDVIDVTRTTPPQPDPTQEFLPVPAPRPFPSIPEGFGEASDVTFINSPNAISPLLSLIRSARRTLKLEFMSLPSLWRQPAQQRNPIVQELVNAAKRGVQVQVLLNDERSFGFPPTRVPPPTPANDITVALLEMLARCQSLPLQAKIVNTKKTGITYIHNKGIIIDDVRTLVSSINGTQNSVMNNREVAIVLESPEAGRYYSSAFGFDWAQSPQFPRKRTPCGDVAPSFLVNALTRPGFGNAPIVNTDGWEL